MRTLEADLGDKPCPSQSRPMLEAAEARIQAIYIVTNPEKLSHLPPPPS